MGTLNERDRDLLRFAANTIGDADCSALFRRLLEESKPSEASEIERLQALIRFQDRVIRSGDVACLTSDERESLEIACMNLAETVRRGREKQDKYMNEGDPEGARWTEKGMVPLVQARVTLRSLVERMK
jgi:ribosomal 50S subunit-associated protein YjgA (DUF615 family)